MSFKILTLTAAFLGAGVLAAAAQSSSSPSSSSPSPSSPPAMNQPSSPSGSATSPSGSATSPSGSANVSAATHCKTASGQVQMKSSGTTGTGSPSSAPISGVSPSIVATLPNC